MSDAAVGPYPTAPPLQPPPPGPITRALQRFQGVHEEPMPLGLAGGVLAAGAVVALMVVGHRPGLGLALAIPVMWAPALPALVRRRAWGQLLTVAIAIGLGAMAAVRDAEWVVVISLLTAFGASAVAATGARSPIGLVLAVPTLPFATARGVRWFARGARSAGSAGRADVLRWVRTGVVTAIILGVFTALLASADAVFASLLPAWDLGALPGQLVVGTLAALTAVTAASLAVRRPVWSAVRAPRPAASRLAEWFVPVLALDALLVAFLVTQAVAAVGGDRYVTATAGLTYAAYARQGFGQLVLVTALTLLVVAWFARRAPREQCGERRATAAALGLLCVAALGIVATALARMALYVQAYGLTELRLLATTGEIVMGVTLLFVLAAGVRWRARWLPLAAVRVAALAVLALALLNPDAMMVRFNSQVQDVPLDTWHLQHLSADAVPAIDGLADEALRSCLLAAYTLPEDTSFWEWNASRAQARPLLGPASERTASDCSAVD